MTETTNNTGNNAQAAPKLDVQDVRREYYEPTAESFAKAQAAIDAWTTAFIAANLPVRYSWDTNNELPAGYGLALVPQTKRTGDKGNEVIGLYIFAVPDPATVLQHERGQQWARETMVDRLVNRAASAVRPRDGSAPVTVPYSVEDFIIPASRDQGLAYFREVAKDVLDGLKKLGFSPKHLNVALLRQILASAAYAQQQFPNIAQTKWEHVLRTLIAKADRDGKDAGIVRVWLDTRNAVDIEAQDFDDSALDSILV